MKYRYVIIIEKAKDNYCAYSPDVPGCIAAGDSVEETRQLMSEALAFHFEGLAQEGLPIPRPRAIVDYIEAEAA